MENESSDTGSSSQMNTPPPINEKEILEVAAALPRTMRTTYLDKACEGHLGVRARLERLLADCDASGFAAFPTAPPAPELEAQFARLKPEEAGERIGHYKLLQQIGEGAFGTVWMAEREKPVSQRVALKIIKLGMDTKEIMARFDQERQALSLMDHPNIAKVLDAGATPTGRMYFVMELVRGIRITEYCDRENLATKERLELFIRVCHAVQHAHQKGIIHRDLKPSNILVELHDGVAVPKIIDFGVAKATQQRLTDLTLFTQVEQMIGTPLYMSPEQAEMSSLDIDTRSDIYALGVLLYELLTGRTPFDPATLLERGLDEIRRLIREQEPARPSTALSTMTPETRTSVARHRQTEPPRLIGLLRGDLDWIVMKALEKNRARRYDTATAFADDLARHLASEPVLARPPSRLYRFRRTIKRNKLAFTAGAAIALAVFTGLGISTWLYFVAKRNGETSAKAANIMGDLLAASEDAEEWYRSEIDPKMMDTLAERLGSGFEDQPIVEMRLRSVIGIRYAKIKEFAKADAMFRRALAIERKERGEASYFLLSEFAPVLESEGKLAEAETMHRQALTASQKTRSAGSDARSADLASWNGTKTANQLVSVLLAEGKLGEAEQVARETLPMGKKAEAIAPGREHVFEAASCYRLATVLRAQNRISQAEAMFRESLAHARRIKLRENEDESELLNRGDLLQNLASLLSHQKALKEARPLAEEAVEWFDNHGYASVGHLNALKVFDEIVVDTGDNAAHASVISKLADVFRSLIVDGSDSPRGEQLIAGLLTPAEERAHPREYAALLTARGEMHGRQGRWREATADHIRALKLDPTVHGTWYRLAPLLLLAGDVAGYREHRRAMLERFQPTKDTDDYLTMQRTAKACLLLPTEGDDLRMAGELADTAVQLREAPASPWLDGSKFSKGLADFRRGDFATVVATLRLVATLHPATDRRYNSAQSYAVLTMALHRLGEPTQARESLAKGMQLAAANVPPYDSKFVGAVGFNWQNALIAQLLLREAQALLGEK